MLWWISVIVPLVSGLGVVGLAILFVAAPAIFTVVVQLLERILGRLVTTRPGCVALALAVAIPCTYGIATNDEAQREAVRQAEARTAFAQRIAGAARQAATNDKSRAAAAEARANEERGRADELAKKIADKACLAPADTDELRKLWGRGAKGGPAARPRSIPNLLRRTDRPAAGGAAH